MSRLRDGRCPRSWTRGPAFARTPPPSRAAAVEQQQRRKQQEGGCGQDQSAGDRRALARALHASVPFIHPHNVAAASHPGKTRAPTEPATRGRRGKPREHRYRRVSAPAHGPLALANRGRAVDLRFRRRRAGSRQWLPEATVSSNLAGPVVVEGSVDALLGPIPRGGDRVLRTCSPPCSQPLWRCCLHRRTQAAQPVRCDQRERSGRTRFPGRTGQEQVGRSGRRRDTGQQEGRGYCADGIRPAGRPEAGPARAWKGWPASSPAGWAAGRRREARTRKAPRNPGGSRRRVGVHPPAGCRLRVQPGRHLCGCPPDQSVRVADRRRTCGNRRPPPPQRKEPAAALPGSGQRPASRRFGAPPDFNRLSALHPRHQLKLECDRSFAGEPDLTNRVIDSSAPSERVRGR